MNIHQLDFNRLVFEMAKFGEPEVEIPPFWRRNLAKFLVGPASFSSFSCFKIFIDEFRASKFSNLNAKTANGRPWKYSKSYTDSCRFGHCYCRRNYMILDRKSTHAGARWVLPQVYADDRFSWVLGMGARKVCLGNEREQIKLKLS